MHQTGHKCRYFESIFIFKTDGNICGLPLCACAKIVDIKDEFLSYVLSFLLGLRQGSYFSVFHPFTQQFLLMVTVCNISTHYIYVSGEQCLAEENVTLHESIL